jgi:hypothetical protein
MAKEDFCFTYYDGDAARDTTHMNRLERGAYHDLVISQRKFGHLTLDQIKKILGKDFTECWPAIELIMKVADGRYFIEWLENSIVKMRKQALHQSANGKQGGRGKKKTQTIPNSKPTESQIKPLGDGNGDEDGIEENNKKEPEENLGYILHGNEDDPTLTETKLWTEDVISGNDYRYKPPISIPVESLHALARDHLGKCARYKWHLNFTSQQAFRESLNNFVVKEYKPEKTTPKNIINERKAKFEQQ